MSKKLLGDQIADLVEDQVLKRLRRKIEIASEPCSSCTRRKQTLNRLHRQWLSITGKPFEEEKK